MAEARDKIQFWPSGAGTQDKYDIQVDPGSKEELDGIIQQVTDLSVIASTKAPVAAIRDLIEFYTFLCDPATQDRIDRDIKRETFYEPVRGKFCQVTADNGVEICIGEYRHVVGPEALTGLSGDLGYLLEELRHKPWFNETVKLELCETIAARGVSEFMKKL
jgi:hypothetical protein